MDRDYEIGEEELNISLVKMVGSLEFIIFLVSNHAEMILFKSWVHFKISNKKMEILEVKLEWFQLENERLIFLCRYFGSNKENQC